MRLWCGVRVRFHHSSNRHVYCDVAIYWPSPQPHIISWPANDNGEKHRKGRNGQPTNCPLVASKRPNAICLAYVVFGRIVRRYARHHQMDNEPQRKIIVIRHSFGPIFVLCIRPPTTDHWLTSIWSFFLFFFSVSWARVSVNHFGCHLLSILSHPRQSAFGVTSRHDRSINRFGFLAKLYYIENVTLSLRRLPHDQTMPGNWTH